MKEKFQFIYDTVSENMKKLDKGEVTVEAAKAMAGLAKQANNVLVTQIDVAKFIHNSKDAEKTLNDVGL
jgi:hypothetical protein